MGNAMSNKSRTNNSKHEFRVLSCDGLTSTFIKLSQHFEVKALR